LGLVQVLHTWPGRAAENLLQGAICSIYLGTIATPPAIGLASSGSVALVQAKSATTQTGRSLPTCQSRFEDGSDHDGSSGADRGGHADKMKALQNSFSLQLDGGSA